MLLFSSPPALRHESSGRRRHRKLCCFKRPRIYSISHEPASAVERRLVPFYGDSRARLRGCFRLGGGASFQLWIDAGLSGGDLVLARFVVLGEGEVRGGRRLHGIVGRGREFSLPDR